MASSLKGKAETQLRLVSGEEAVVIPEGARPTDDSPTVISKNPPVVDSTQDKIVDLARKSATPESILAGLRGQRLAHYELIAPIGVGGMAAVIRARDSQLDRFVALKILPPEMAQEPENIQRFHQEAKAAAKLDHANIARVFFCGEDQGLHFIAFEFVEGMNLRALMEERGRLPVAESIRYIVQIAAGLEHACSRGVVHRDVKPSNIIITPHGQAKLVDMGLARNLERKGERDLTQSGMTLGTFDYISPEQALEPRDADVRSDIYSLGCTLYHMLTGVPPVPEGTPAKKLDHHQHHMPVDPRRFNSDIPDEVVMVLGKMMAKKPGDRYQRPIQLVQHLMQIAKKVGAADDVPEGVLFVDTPLPGQPRNRPVLMIGLALVALLVLTLFFSFVPDTKQAIQPNPPIPPVSDKGGAPVKAMPGTGAGQVVEDVPAKAPPEVRSVADLKAVLDDRRTTSIASTLVEQIELAKDGLVFQGGSEQRLALSSSDPEANLKFQYDKDGSAFGIVIDGGREVHFKGIKILIESKSTPERAAAALAVRGVKTVTFEQCMFVQYRLLISSSEKKVPLSAVLIEAPAGAKPVVNFHKCYFDGGQVAVAINGPATVNVSNCAFGPHSAFFSFRDKCTLQDTVLSMNNCTGLFEKGPAFRFGPNASAQLDVRSSVFARPGNDGAGGDLLALYGDRPALQFVGKENLYHSANSLIRMKDKAIEKFDDFRGFLQRQRLGSDDGSIQLDFADTPFQHPDPLSYKEDPRAFQLKEKYYKTYGLQKTWTGDNMIAPPTPLVKAAPKKVVDPLGGGAFKTIGAALAEAKDGDVIYIRAGDDRKIVVPPVSLRPGISVTIKPEDDHAKPVLVLDRDFFDKDSSLFKVQQKGKLAFENIEFLLDPEQGLERRSVVQMGEAAYLSFEKCLFTLKAPKGVELSVVNFLDLDKAMKMESAVPGRAEVEFRECFVRGKGTLVALQGCRKLDVRMTNSLVALDGSLLDIMAASKEMAMDQGVHWTMDRSSIYTTESVFALRAKSGLGLTRTKATIRDCLLVSLAPDQRIVLPETPATGMLDKYLLWDCDHNLYANFDGRDLGAWKDQFPEMTSKYEMLMIAPKGPLWDVTPDLLKPAAADLERVNGFGIPPQSEKLWLPTMPTKDEP